MASSCAKAVVSKSSAVTSIDSQIQRKNSMVREEIASMSFFADPVK
jgi:hypothetical protein